MVGDRTFTPLGTVMGMRPILLIVLYHTNAMTSPPHAEALCLAAAHDALGRRHDDKAQAAHALGDLALGRVDSQARPADALQAVDDALAVLPVF